MPAGLRVEEEEVIVLRDELAHARIPDVAVFRTGPGGAELTNSTPAADVVLIVEIISPGSQRADRVEKPLEYAAAGIPSFWLIEVEPEVVVRTFQLDGEFYVDAGHYRRGGLLKDVTLPWVSVEVDELTRDRATGD